MGKKNWQGSNTRSSSCGTMICCHCNQKIIEGDYAFYQDSEGAFTCAHRRCSEHLQEMWDRIDKKRAVLVIALTERIEAFEQFAKKWGTSLLDDEIENLRYRLEKAS